MNKKILIAGPIFSISGYGDYARTVCHNLSRIEGIDIRLDIKNWGGQTSIMSKEENKFFHNLLQKPPFEEDEWQHVTYLMIHLPDGYPLHEEKFFKYKQRINLTMFETDNILDHWADCINKHVDAVMVPTEFNKQTFLKKVKKPIHVFTYVKNDFHVLRNKIPNPPLPRILNKDNTVSNGIRKPLVFYHNCNYGARKGVVEVVRTYLNAFKNIPNIAYIKNDEEIQNHSDPNFPSVEKIRPTQLWLKWYIDFSHPEHEKQHFKNVVDKVRKETDNYSSEIYLIHENYFPHQMEALYENIDVYTMPSRGEGLNLPATEAILHDKPIMLSECSAHTTLIPDQLNELENESEFFKPYWLKGENRIIDNTGDPFYAKQAHIEGHKWFFVDEKYMEAQYIKIYNDIINDPNKMRNTCNLVKQHIINIADPKTLAEKFDKTFFQ